MHDIVASQCIIILLVFSQIGMMSAPLQVVQDDQGRLRDVNDQPMIMIFNSKPRRPRTSRRSYSAKEKPGTVASQSFAFINVTRPDEENEDDRKLIRTHVMQDLQRRERQKSYSGVKEFPPASAVIQKPSGRKVLSLNTISCAIPPQPSSDGSSFVVFPVHVELCSRGLIHQCKHTLMYYGALFLK